MDVDHSTVPLNGLEPCNCYSGKLQEPVDSLQAYPRAPPIDLNPAVFAVYGVRLSRLCR